MTYEEFYKNCEARYEKLKLLEDHIQKVLDDETVELIDENRDIIMSVELIWESDEQILLVNSYDGLFWEDTSGQNEKDDWSNWDKDSDKELESVNELVASWAIRPITEHKKLGRAW